MNVAYGPPGETGVSTLMHVGQDEVAIPPYEGLDIERVSRNVGLGAVAVWAYAAIAKKPKLKRAALLTAMVAFVAQAVGKR